MRSCFGGDREAREEETRWRVTEKRWKLSILKTDAQKEEEKEGDEGGGTEKKEEEEEGVL